jgi:hypothetical protein
MNLVNKKKTRAKKKKVPEVDLVDSPYAHLFSAFLTRTKELQADNDKVNGLTREYVSTAQLQVVYNLCFGKDALAESTTTYRIHQIKPEEFADDFLKLESLNGAWEPKYFVNRLNTELLRKIYLPQTPHTIRVIAEKTKLLDDIFRIPADLPEEEDDW